MDTQEKKAVVPNAKETALLELLRGLGYGEVRVIVQAGVPVRVEEIRKAFSFECPRVYPRVKSYKNASVFRSCCELTGITRGSAKRQSTPAVKRDGKSNARHFE